LRTPPSTPGNYRTGVKWENPILGGAVRTLIAKCYREVA
jgi:hypothetical protein